MKSAKANNVKVVESIIKLLMITYINQSFCYQSLKPLKSIECLIKATKLTEQFRLKSFKGKLLKFIAKLRQCELYIQLKKYDLGTSCAQQVLQEVMKKLEKHKKSRKILDQLGMVAVTAFYRIGICEECKGLHKAAESAFENANLIGKKYLNKDEILLELDYEMITHKKLFSKKLLEKKKNLRITDISSDKKAALIKTEETQNEAITTKNADPSPKLRRSLSIENTDENIFGRYYTNKELDKLTKMLKEEKNRKILNTDNYFFNKFSKTLAISELSSSPTDTRRNVNEQLEEI